MKGGGGKKKKRGKNTNNISKPFVEPTDKQYFAKVIKNKGSCRFELEVYFYTEDEKTHHIDFRKEIKMGVVRGSMQRRHYVNQSDIVLVSEREFEKSKVDIIAVYKTFHYNKIKYHRLAPSDIIDSHEEGEVSFYGDSDCSDDNLSNTSDYYRKNKENTKEKKEKKNKPYNEDYMANIGLPSYNSESENDSNNIANYNSSNNIVNDFGSNNYTNDNDSNSYNNPKNNIDIDNL